MPILQEEAMKNFLIWWLHDSTFREWFAVQWLLSITIVLLFIFGYVIFWHLREWFAIRPGRKK